MRLQFHHSGRQFFFITVALAGRESVLSEVVAGERRPRLSWLGEAVLQAFLSLHKVYPALTASDSVIMPDHFHLLLIVDYAKSPSLDPLWVCQRLLEAVEAAWSRGPGCAGEVEGLFRKAVERGRQRADEYYAGLAEGRTGAPPPFPRDSVALLNSALPCDSAALAQGGGGEAPVLPSKLPRFERSPWIDLSFDARQLKAIRHYIRLNPQRYLWKRAHPDLFVCHRAIRSARLARFAPRRFDGLGNLPLLGSPFLLHVRLTLKKTISEHAAAIAEILEKARRGYVPVSGFISPGEKELLRQLKAEPRARFVRLLPSALPPRYDPSAEDSREIAAGRMAILSLQSTVAPISGLEIKRSAAASHQFRQNCLEMNEIAARLCAADDQT